MLHMVANKKGAYGVVDSNGTEVLPCRFRGGVDMAKSSCLGVEIGKKGKLTYIYRKQTHELAVAGLAQAAFLDRQHIGLWTTSSSGSDYSLAVLNLSSGHLEHTPYADIGVASEGYHVARLPDRTKVLLSLHNMQTAELDIGKHTVAGPLAEGLFQIMNRSGKFGYASLEEGIIIKPTYQSATNFHGGCACVAQSGTYRFIKQDGTNLTNNTYQSAIAFYGAGCPVATRQKWGLLGYQGELILPCHHDGLLSTEHAKAFIKRDSLWGAIDLTGKELLPCQYTDIRDSGTAPDRYIVSDDGGHSYHLINQKGKRVGTDSFDSIDAFAGRFARIYKGKQLGFMNKSGKIFFVD